jgi:N-acylneuraminate cytidylyltransferase
MKILGFIPARAGSQRIPNKNLRKLGGKPLIAYTIEAAKSAKRINRIVVSTDSPGICKVSKYYGAEAPFLRPKNISGSHSTEMEFLIHALDWFKKNEGYVPDLIVLLYPTSPFRKAETIDRAIKKILNHPEADSLRSVKLCKEHPHKMWQIKNEYLKPLLRSKIANMHTLSYQLLPTVYIQNASIYITRPKTILMKKSPTGNKIIPFVMDSVESIDINTILDFQMADLIIRNNKK